MLPLLVELDSDGNVRSKTGFFVDDFSGGMNLTSSSTTPDFIDDENVITESLDLGPGIDHAQTEV